MYRFLPVVLGSHVEYSLGTLPPRSLAFPASSLYIFTSLQGLDTEESGRAQQRVQSAQVHLVLRKRKEQGVTPHISAAPERYRNGLGPNYINLSIHVAFLVFLGKFWSLALLGSLIGCRARGLTRTSLWLCLAALQAVELEA